jgi:hypothetical protein
VSKSEKIIPLLVKEKSPLSTFNKVVISQIFSELKLILLIYNLRCSSYEKTLEKKLLQEAKV